MDFGVLVIVAITPVGDRFGTPMTAKLGSVGARVGGVLEHPAGTGTRADANHTQRGCQE